MKAVKRWLMKAFMFFMIAVFLLMVGLTLATDHPNTFQKQAEKEETREAVIVRIEGGQAIYGYQDEPLRKKEGDLKQGEKRQSVHDPQASETTDEQTFHPDPSMKSYGLLDDIGRQAGDALSSLTRKSINHFLGGSR